MHLLGFRFAPRIRDLSDTKLYLPNGNTKYRALASMIGGTVNLRTIRTQWTEILRLATLSNRGLRSCSASWAATLDRTVSQWPCTNWAESSEPCSSSPGCRALISAAAFTPVSTKAKLATPRQGRLPLPPRRDQRPQLRAATLQGKRPHPRHGRNRTLEHRLYKAFSPGLRPERPTRRSRAAQIPLPARLGAHQPHWRLPVERQETRSR